MESARCKAFLAAAETGSLSAAAEQLNYTPSGVSQLVSALERELQLTLLHRSKKGVALTDAGRILLPTVRDFLAQETRIRQVASDLNGLLIGSVTIASYSSLAIHRLSPVIRDFQTDYPHVQINLLEGIRQEICSWLDSGTADLAFFSYQDPMPYDWIPLVDDPMIAALPRNHPLADASAYPLERCGKDPLIMPGLGRDEDVLSLLSSHGLTPNIAFSTVENFSAMSMVEQGLGVCLMNELITKNWVCDVVKLPLDPPQSLLLGMALPAWETAAPAVRRFGEYAVRRLTQEEQR